MKKTRGKLHFFIFRNFFAPLEAKMMKNDKQNDKKMKKNERKIAIFHFLENCNFPRVFFSCFFIFFFIFFSCYYHFFIIFHHFSSFFINSTTGSKNDKKMIKKMIKKWKKLEENCNFLFFGKFLHHWKQKWWKMIKTWKNWKKKEKKWKKMKKW